MIQTLSDALAERGYDTLTPVQEAVTNPDLESSDLLVSAQTGSGKTVGFGLAIAPTLLGDDARFGPAAAPLALVVALEAGICVHARLALGSVGPRPLRVAAAEEILIGSVLGPQDANSAGEILAAACDPVDDTRASGAYRRRLVPRVLQRALNAARDGGA